MNQPFHLAIAFDKNYITLVYVFLTSVFENNAGTSFVIHAIASDVGDADKEAIKRFANKNESDVMYYTIEPEDLQGLVIGKTSHLTAAAYYRWFFPALVPAQVKELLYLDVDVVVVGRLEGIFQTDISPYAVGAVLDGGIGSRAFPHLGIVEKNNYFNSGVLLMDVEKWRNEKVTERAFAFMQAHAGKIKHEDQDVLNGTLVNQWYKLDGKYNVTLFDIPKQLKIKDYKAFISDKVIIHYTKKEDKPWLMLNKNRLRYLYHDYLMKSPAAEKKKYVDFNYKPVLLYRYFKIRTAERLAGHPHLLQMAKKAKLA